MNVEKLRAAKIYVYLRKLAKSVLKANSQAWDNFWQLKAL